MTPTYIASSNIEAVAYEMGKLYIQFKSGTVYSYDKVPFDYFDAIQKVESAGKFFHQFIKGKFHYEKLSFIPWRTRKAA